MRKTIEPPPALQCGKCAGQIRLKQVENANAALGLSNNIFACTTCGTERIFTTRRDQYSPHAAAPQRLWASAALKRPVAARFI